MRAAGVFVALVLLPVTPGLPRAQAVVRADTATAITDGRREFHLISRENYLRRHAFSLDHFLEFEPGGVLTRLGPIGNDAFYSRWGIGRGRALVVVNGIPVNNPQDGTAPLAHIATSGLATMTLDAPAEPVHAAMEGSIVLRDLVAPPARPRTFIELSKGTNSVRQRRVRFASETGPVGLDLSYDEVLDDGYAFDATDPLPGESAEGQVRSRNGAIVVRGELADDESYSIGLRRYRSSSTGDLSSPFNESTQSGHLAWATVGSAANATVYGRGYKSDRPDSVTANQGVGAVVAWEGNRDGARLHLFALGEHTNATQHVGGGAASSRVNLGNVGAGAQADAGGVMWFAHGNVAGDEHASAWGAGAGVVRAVPRGDVTLSARRLSRLPTISERYLPHHTRDGRVLLGNLAVDAESAWEAAAEWKLRAGVFTSRMRASWMRSQDYIAFLPVADDAAARRATNSPDVPAMMFIEERLGVAAMLGTIEVRGDAGAYYSSGDREGAFRSVPSMQVNAALELGRQLFEKSSAVYVGGEYAFVDERSDYRGVPLASHHVVNLSLVGRLVDARFYLRWLNLLDESYQTVSGYLMTPRTLAYGIEWTLFD